MNAVYDLPVRQDLMGLPGAKLGDITLVVSHEQALRQSARFLESLGVKTQAYSNTAEAAKYEMCIRDSTWALEHNEGLRLAEVGR